MTTIFEEAEAIVIGTRKDIYGPAEEYFVKLAKMWELILGVPLTAEQVCLCKIAEKVIRLANTPGHRDSQIDICGYARLLEIICENYKKNTVSG